MKAQENQSNRQLENKHSKDRWRAIDQLAIGSIILFWGSLLTLRQVGIIDRNVSTLPFVLTAFGILLVAGGIHRLSRSTCL